MRLTGKLKSWNDDRGFGFIVPSHGGADLFVHISALPRDGSKPTVGETVTYELGRGKNGQPQAVKVIRTAIGPAASRVRGGRHAPGPGSGRGPAATSVLPKIVVTLLVVALGAFGYSQYEKRVSRYSAQSEAPPTAALEQSSPSAVASRVFNCDGRTHCSQMTSCAEAKFFLRNCPGVKMDGNNDGIPCEQQWCTNPFAR